MSKFDDAMVKYRASLASLNVSVNEDLLTGVAKGLGPSIYLADASMVACTDKTERDRVKTNFLVKKLGLDDSPALDAAVSKVCEKMSGINQKHRAVFYYLLVVQEGLESKYLN